MKSATPSLPIRLLIWLLTFFCWLGFFVQANAQVTVVIADSLSQDPVPFALVQKSSQTVWQIANLDGEVVFSSLQPGETLCIRSPLYPPACFVVPAEAPSPLRLFLGGRQSFAYTRSSDPAALETIWQALDAKPRYHPERIGGLRYQTYHRLHVEVAGMDELKKTAQKWLRFFTPFKGTLQVSTEPHHLLLTESVTQQEYLNRLNFLETVAASKVSGVDQPQIFAMTSQYQTFSLYDRRVQITGSLHYSPLMDGSPAWYAFADEGVFQTESGPVQVIRFHPLPAHRQEFLKGYLYIGLTDFSLRYAEVWPSGESQSEMEVLQEYGTLEGASQSESRPLWLPMRTQTAFYRNRYLSASRMSVISQSAVYQAEAAPELRRRRFDEVVLDYEKDPASDLPGYWPENRQFPFSRQDSLTYAFYDTVGNIRNFGKLLQLGEAILYGELPVGMVNIDMKRLLNFNDWEGLRVGVGLRTNEALSDRFSIGGYFGYGLGDNRFKAGLSGDLLLARRPELSLRLRFQDDVQEAGGMRLLFERPQFSTEQLRNLRLFYLDRERRGSIGLQTRLFRYLSIAAEAAETIVDPRYDYAFQDSTRTQFRLAEWTVGMHFAYGEQFVRPLHRLISLGTRYPVFWAQISRGMQGVWSGEYAYTRIDLRVQGAREMPGVGTSYVQAHLGWVNGLAPYARLFNGNGSYRPFAAIARNSFETMNYNEFLSDRFFALYFTHRFGPVFVRKFKKSLLPEVVQHIGWGALRNPEDHLLFPFRTMEKGFAECGLYLNNLLAIGALGGELTLGTGAFLRYGPYAHPGLGENILFKIAVEFSL